MCLPHVVFTSLFPLLTSYWHLFWITTLRVQFLILFLVYSFVDNICGFAKCFSSLRTVFETVLAYSCMFCLQQRFRPKKCGRIDTQFTKGTDSYVMYHCNNLQVVTVPKLPTYSMNTTLLTFLWTSHNNFLPLGMIIIWSCNCIHCCTVDVRLVCVIFALTITAHTDNA